MVVEVVVVADFGEAHGALAVVVVEVEAAALAEEEEVDVVVVTVIAVVIASLAEEEEIVPVIIVTKKGTLQGSVPKETAGTVKIMGTTQDPPVLINL